MALPDDGPTTREKVKARLGIADADTVNDVEIDDHVDAVNEMVRGLPLVADLDEDAEAFPNRSILGATMLAFRIYRRRNSASGIEAFGSDGAVYTQRNDPDIAQLLGLGPYEKPSVG